jgi:predicted ATPase
VITRIEATRYRCFDKLDVELGDFRVLVGANGSGKTTLLDVPVLLGDLLRERTVSEAFTEQRDGRAPRATALRELIFQGQGGSSEATALRGTERSASCFGGTSVKLS